MNSFAILAAILAVAATKPLDQHVSVSQDTLGNYKLKYAIDGISRAEERNIHGDVSGGYSYIDPNGVLRKIEFIAGEQGFIPISGDLPKQVEDTPEVALAKAEHLALLRASELEHGTPIVAEVSAVEIPVRAEEIPVKVEVPLLKSETLELPEIPVVRSFNTGEVVEVDKVDAPLLRTVEVPIASSHSVRIPLLKSEGIEIPEIPVVRSLSGGIVEVERLRDIPLLKTALPDGVVGKYLVKYVIPDHSEVYIARIEH